MGRYTTESSKRIELSWLKLHTYFPKGGGLVGGTIQWSSHGEPTGNIFIKVNTQEDEPYLQMIYKTRDPGGSDEDWRDKDYKFPLEKIPCRYGGYKWFVRCQLSKNGIFCGRRVRILYSVGDWFGCRHCADLTYERCNYAGRYKGFLSVVDLENQEEKVKRRFYRGRPTRKYRKLFGMEQKFNASFLAQLTWLKGKHKS